MPIHRSLPTPGARAAYLCRHHRDELLRLATGPHPSPLSRSTAEDALQEVLQQLAAPCSKAPERPDALFAYAVTAVRRTNARLVREQSAAPHVPLEAYDGAAHVPDPASLVERREAATIVRRAVERLGSVRTQRIARLHVRGLDRATIASTVGATPRAVRSAIERFDVAVREERRALG
jgi:DNA-directed RNA polymerase specialized sigma24 family protein